MKRARRGSHQRFIEKVAVPYTGDDCLIWPFPYGDAPYPTTRWKGKCNSVHVHVCTLAHGPRPEGEKITVAHSCGRGTDGCVNPNHLSWKTQRENIADKKSHGTEPVGEERWSSKLTEKEAIEIISMRGNGMKQKDIGEIYGIEQAHVSAIMTGKKWKHLHRPYLK